MMHIPKREEIIIRLIHRNFIFVVLGIIVAGILIVYGLQRGGILGGQGEILGTSDVTGSWKVSDHTSSGTLLNNSMSATDVPRYDDTVTLNLQRDNSGNINALPRFQGELEYHKK